MSTQFYGHLISKDNIFPFCKSLRKYVDENQVYINMVAIEEENEGIFVHIFDIPSIKDKYVISVIGMSYGFLNHQDNWSEYLTPFYFDDRASCETEIEQNEMDSRKPFIDEIEKLIQAKETLWYHILTKEQAKFILWEKDMGDRIY